ncbi:hypothetical protein LXD80_12475 [Enterobacter sp. ASE]|uniref:tetratricopeptide repeat protein n=1 Tax=Enterobacter sp. ASE TaxID=2905968 RepID=UPI001E65C62A|nr:hypothetical protein [Enterobacter sp. ASE]MCE3116609.1 hypothetical protein [Enterobacter sp. ASE]
MRKSVLLLVLTLCACSTSGTPINDQDTSTLAVKVGALDKALELTKAETQRDPNNFASRFKLADIYHRLKRYDMENNELNAIKAMASLQTADKNRVYINLMRNSLLRDDYDGTIKLYNESDFMKETSPLQMQGNRELYYAVSWCKKGNFYTCLSRLNRAKTLLPGDERVAQNMQLAQWMKNARHGTEDNNASLLYKAYNENQSASMFSNLVLSLVKQEDYGRAFEVLTTHYSAEDANIIIADLKQMRI